MLVARDIRYCFLNKIRSFLCICGIIDNYSIAEIPNILFLVVYSDRNRGIVRGRS